MLQDVPTDLGGRYRVAERLGRGGMADVHRAEDLVLHRTVAVKIFRGGMERESDLARFRAEVRTLAGLTHPHLVALYDAGGDVAQPWCAMEYVDGGSLVDRTETVPREGVARLGQQVASALAHVHGRGIVHRDVKPSNVLLSSRGSAFLSDFGVARLVDGTRMTQSGLMIGTAAYLSPEQVRGETAGPAADVYALGLVLLEILTGRREYPGSAVESAVARLSRRPAVPDDLDPGWYALLTAMTALDPDDRPAAADVAARLDGLAFQVETGLPPALVAGDPPPTEPTPAPLRTPTGLPLPEPALAPELAAVTVLAVPAASVRGPAAPRSRRGIMLFAGAGVAAALAIVPLTRFVAGSTGLDLTTGDPAATSSAQPSRTGDDLLRRYLAPLPEAAPSEADAPPRAVTGPTGVPRFVRATTPPPVPVPASVTAGVATSVVTSTGTTSSGLAPTPSGTPSVEASTPTTPPVATGSPSGSPIATGGATATTTSTSAGG